MKKTRITILVLAFASILVAAQEKPAEKKSTAAKQTGTTEKKPAATASKPGPEITKLIKMFSGTWTTDEKIEPGAMAPKGGSSQGMATFRAGPGGNSLIEEYSSPHGLLGPFKGHGVTWWDAKEGAYKGTWCDSMTPDCMVGGMKWEGDNIVGIPQQMDMGGQKMVMTSKYSDLKPDSITYTMGMGPSAEQAKTTMTIVYKKAAAGAMPAAKKETEKKEAEPTKK